MRAAVILAGVVLGLGGFLLAVIYAYIIDLGCEGSDAGEPPSPGSVGASLCDSPALPPLVLVLAFFALAAPVVGGVLAARRRGVAALLGCLAVAAAALSAMGLLLLAAEDGGANGALFVGAPVLACLALVAVAAGLSRSERRD